MVDSLYLQKSYLKIGDRDVQAHCACKKKLIYLVYFQKRSYWWLGLLCLQINIWFTSFMFDSYTPRNFHTKKTNQRGSWACYAHIKILHSPHLHWLSHVMQFSKKEQVIWARLLTAFEKILDSPHLHLILIHWYVFEPPRQKLRFLMIFVFKAGVKFKIAFQIEQKILISVC